LRSTKEVYRTDPKELKGMKYLDALKRKRQDAREYITQELDKNYLARDTHEINRKIKAVQFVETLINEVENA